MSYELVKIQSREGYAYTPQGNRHINFSFNEPSVIDMSKSYVVLNTSVVVTPNATLRTATGADFIVNPALGSVGQTGVLDYKSVALIRNARLTSESVKDLDQYSRDVNILETNKQVYSKNLADHQKDSITQGNFSVLDTKTRRIKNSVFLNVQNEGNVKSNLGAADLILPMSDLFSDLGNMMLYPSGLFQTQNMELELENRLGVIDVANSIEAPGLVFSFAAAQTVEAADAAKNTLNIPVAMRNSAAEQQAEFYVGQPIQLTFTLKEDGGANIERTASAVINAINYNPDPLESDGLATPDRDGICQLTLSKTLAVLITRAAGQVVTTVSKVEVKSVKTFDGTPSFIVNRAELVIARRRLNPDVVRDYYSQLMKNGMQFSYWSATSWNKNSVDRVDEFWTLGPQALGFLNLSPTFTGNTPTLYSLKNGLQSYRVTVGDMETTNRDILISAGNTSALYKHKVISTLGACNLPLKSLNDNLSEALNGSAKGIFIAYPVDYLPQVDEPLLLKLTMNGAAMPLGPSYLFVKYNKVINFE